jgi:hypothetical protein
MRKMPGHNVVPLSAKTRDGHDEAPGLADDIAAGSADDPQTREALRLMEAFLAIEDAQGRAALVTLAERLVSYDWARAAKQR